RGRQRALRSGTPAAPAHRATHRRSDRARKLARRAWQYPATQRSAIGRLIPKPEIKSPLRRAFFVSGEKVRFGGLEVDGNTRLIVARIYQPTSAANELTVLVTRHELVMEQFHDCLFPSERALCGINARLRAVAFRGTRRSEFPSSSGPTRGGRMGQPGPSSTTRVL